VGQLRYGLTALKYYLRIPTLILMILLNSCFLEKSCNAEDPPEKIDIGLQTCSGALGSVFGAVVGYGVGFGLGFGSAALTNNGKLVVPVLFSSIVLGNLFLSSEEVYATGKHNEYYSIVSYMLWSSIWPNGSVKEYKELFKDDSFHKIERKGSYWKTFLGGLTGLALGAGISYGVYRALPQQFIKSHEAGLGAGAVVLTLGLQTTGEIIGFRWSL